MRAGPLAGVVAAACVLGACGFITGIGDLQETACGADCGLGADGAVEAAMEGSESGADSAADARADVDSDAPPCVPSGPEVCTDGVDNDCNGLVDCADPACASFACVPAVPNGSSLVALSAAARPACPTGYTGSSDLLVDPSLGPFTCGCSCNVSAAPSCTVGPLDLKDGTGCTLTVTAAGNAGACTPHTFGSPTHSLVPLPATGGSCMLTTTATPPAAGTLGRSCTVAGGLGGGCGTGSVCAAKTTAPYRTCVKMTAAARCPTGYPNTHTAGSGLASDTRGCNACSSCTPPAATCANAQMSFYSSIGCIASVGVLPANSLCDPTSWSAAAYRYQATVTNAQCAAPPTGQPTGSVTLGNPETICCE
jgi:hypothetical protein